MNFLYEIVCASNVILGDLNGDENINVSDVVLLINLILSNNFSEAGDLNTDQSVNIQDVVLLVQIILSS